MGPVLHLPSTPPPPLLLAPHSGAPLIRNTQVSSDKYKGKHKYKHNYTLDTVFVFEEQKSILWALARVGGLRNTFAWVCPAWVST